MPAQEAAIEYKGHQRKLPSMVQQRPVTTPQFVQA